MSKQTRTTTTDFGQVFLINSLPACQMVNAGIDVIVLDPDTKFEACRRYYEAVDSDILFYFNDIAIQAEAMGAKIHVTCDAMPCIAEPARVVQTPNPATWSRMQANAQVTTRLKACFPEKLISTIVYGPFTVAGQLMGEQTILRKIVHEPGEVQALLGKTFRVAREYADYLLNSGADVLWISDPLSALLPPNLFWDFAGELLASIFDRYASTPSIIHICGDVSQIVGRIVDTGVAGISFDQCMDLLLVEDEVPDNIAMIGNIDPTEQLEQGSPEQIEADVIDLANLMGGKPNYVMSSGCAPPPMTPIKNLQIFTKTARTCLEEIDSQGNYLNNLRQSVFECEKEDSIACCQVALQNQVSAPTLVNAGLMRSVRKGSAYYEAKKRFLPDILLIADTFYAGYQYVMRHLPENPEGNVTMILGTVKGDFHEIGKDLVKIFVEINGFRVVDLGVNVEPEAFIGQAVATNAPIIGLSAFVTSARRQLENVIQLAQREGLHETSIIVGGAAVNRSIAADIGSHGYARNAVEAVTLVRNLLGKN